VHDPVVLEDDAALLVHLVAGAVPGDHPAAFDERSHGDVTSSSTVVVVVVVDARNGRGRREDS